MSDKQHELWMSIRQALLIATGAIERYLGLERSTPPRKRRKQLKKDNALPRDGSDVS